MGLHVTRTNGGTKRGILTSVALVCLRLALRVDMQKQAKHFAFVLMPFDKRFDDVYNLGIKGATDKVDDLVAERVDEQIYREGILERIYRHIEVADIIIADMTGQTPTCFMKSAMPTPKENSAFF